MCTTHNHKRHTPIVWVKYFRPFLGVRSKVRVTGKNNKPGEKRGDREEALSRDVIHTATYIFLLFLTTESV